MLKSSSSLTPKLITDGKELKCQPVSVFLQDPATHQKDTSIQYTQTFFSFTE
jgi:hypothetical protein